MDKFEYELKVEQIEKLIGREDYSTAKKIADTMEWKREKDPKLLSHVAEIYAQAGDIEKALKIYNFAYNVSSRGLLILERMTELALIYGQLDLAEELCEEYRSAGAYESDYYLFRFQIAESRGEDLDKRISWLEKYCGKELDEEALYRLAWMYDRAGRDQDCVRICDYIIDFFCSGESVERAIQLKRNHAPLTKYQERRVTDAAKYEENYQRYLKSQEEEERRTRRERKHEEQIREDALMEEQENDLGKQISRIVEQEEQEKQEVHLEGLVADEELMASLSFPTAASEVPEEEVPVEDTPVKQIQAGTEKMEPEEPAEPAESPETEEEQEPEEPAEPAGRTETQEEQEPEEPAEPAESPETEEEQEAEEPAELAESPETEEEQEPEEPAELEESPETEEEQEPEEPAEPAERPEGEEEQEAEEPAELAESLESEEEQEPEKPAAGRRPFRKDLDLSALDLVAPEGSFKVVCSDTEMGVKYALELVRMVPEEERSDRVAKISARQVNKVKFSAIENQLDRDILLITDAGQLTNGALESIYTWMKKSMDNRVILVDDQEQMSGLEKRKPKLMKRFAKAYPYEKKDTQEWLELVDCYVDENGCVLADDAYQLFETYLRDKEEKGDVVLGVNLKDAVQDALHQATKISLGNILASILDTKYDEDGLLILRDRHFI